MAASVYEIHHKRVSNLGAEAPLPTAKYSWRDSYPAPEHERDLAFAVIKSIADRCAPHLRFLVGPQLWNGEKWVGGCAFCSDHTIAIVLSDTYYSGGLAHHEIWHMVENEMHPSDKAFVDGCTREEAVVMPYGYYDSGDERRARLYQRWGQARDEGWRPVAIAGRPLSRLDAILEHVYSGGHAANVAADHAPEAHYSLPVVILRAAVAWPMCALWPLGLVLALIA